MEPVLQSYEQSAAPAAERSARWIFTGPDGLRAGWSCLLFAAIFVTTDLLAGWALRSVMHAMMLKMTHGSGHLTTLPLGFGFLMEIVQSSGAFAATIAMAKIEGRTVLAYGFEGHARAARLLAGLGLGFAAICAFILVLWRAGLLAFDGRPLHGTAIWKYGLGWSFLFLFVAFFEESALRGYLQYTLTRGIGFWWGALLMSFLFGFSHGTNPGETMVGLFSAGAVGLVLCLSLWYTGSLWWAVGFHAAWDWGQSFFFGTSDSGMAAQGHLFAAHPVGCVLWSGGTTGPEGSLLVLPLLGCFALGIWLWWGRGTPSPFGSSGWKPSGPG